ncbi:TOMM precursor leader peptide-binding protein [Bacillus safensis]|uniref:TOMM precursor leader peptide-binding protein n=1 Tax=Bacillus safensis TaxID=561879 RepID=UPI0022AB6ED9|nr:TOMM precursor leader peptide-binding protein [Bacillus safensis]WAT82377.1 TOMM precursor leader peptide-binding protein [Bacillus safensis]
MFVKDQEMTRYKLAPHITLGKLEDSLIGLKAQTVTKIEGDGIIDFIQEISDYLTEDNGVSIKELEENFEVESDQLKHVLEFLVANGMCVKTDMTFDLTALLSYERAGGQVLVEDIIDRLKTGIVEVITRDHNPVAAEFIRHLQEAGLQVVLKGELNKQPDIRVAIGNSHLDPIFEEINDLALEDHIPWLSIVPYDGQTSWVGPFFIPHQSACLHCYNLRKSANFSDEVLRSDLMKIKPVNPEKKPVYHMPINLVQVGIASNLILEWLTLKDYAPSATPGGFTTINLDDKGVSCNHHRVYRVPRCPKCSPAADTGFPQVWFHGEVNN